MLVGPDFSDEGLVFHYPDGLPPTRRRQRSVPPPSRANGLPRLTLHGLRHTWATLALEQGIHPRVVQERLGHSTIAITLASTATSARRSTTRQRTPLRDCYSRPDLDSGS
jgi:integrase